MHCVDLKGNERVNEGTRCIPRTGTHRDARCNCNRRKYHAPLRLAYKQITFESKIKTSDQKCLDFAEFAINLTEALEGLCSALLVNRVVPSSVKTSPVPTQLSRALLI